jgi:dolichol-phosphate mannosyltransferase
MLGYIRKTFQDKKKRTRFVRFAIIGLLGFVVNSLFLELFRGSGVGEFFAGFFQGIPQSSFFSLAGEPSAWAAALATEIAIISNFTLNNIWTFRDHKIEEWTKIAAKFFQFNLTSGGTVIIQFVVIGTGTMLFMDTVFVRQVFLVVSVAFFIVPYNWFMYNVIIWKTGKGKNGKGNRA